MKKKVDCLIILTHTGIELLTYPLERDAIIYKKMIDYGADLIVGGHPHCVQIYETYKNKYIFYSIGDFIFDHFSLAVSNKFINNVYKRLHFENELNSDLCRYSMCINLDYNKITYKLDVTFKVLFMGDDGISKILNKKELNNWLLIYSGYKRKYNKKITKNKLGRIQNALINRLDKESLINNYSK